MTHTQEQHYNKPFPALQARLDAHRLWAETGGEQGTQLVVGAEDDLTKLDLQGCDLRGADFGGTTLEGARLRDADLRLADLSGCRLVDADLGGADVAGANVFVTFLNPASLRGVKNWDKAEHTETAFVEAEDGRSVIAGPKPRD